MINYLITQIGSIEGNLNGSSRLVRNLQEKDRDSMLRLANDNRSSTD
jgi:hypothetical protein